MQSLGHVCNDKVLGSVYDWVKSFNSNIVSEKVTGKKEIKPVKECFWCCVKDEEDGGNDGYGGNVEDGLEIRQENG